jgi:hypothetical protein
MGRSQLKSGLKHSIHEDGLGITQGPEGNLYVRKTYKRITPDHDCSINRENPNRKMPSARALVVGYDGAGNFANTIPHGATHGYWTLANILPQFCPFDGAGASGNYIARSLFEFDLDDAGITAADNIESAKLTLHYYKSKSIKENGDYAFDLHRFHPGLTGNTGGDGHAHDNKFTSNATWWEYDYTNTATGCSPGYVCGVSGCTGTFLGTSGGTHGTYRWEYQGLGATGSTAEHTNTGIGGATGWLDYSGGPVGSNQDEYSDNLYTGFTASRIGQYAVIAGAKLELDITDAVTDAKDNYNNKLRFMIKLRNDHAFEAGATTEQNRLWIAFHSSEAETDIGRGGISDVSSVSAAKYSPSLHITYWDKS